MTQRVACPVFVGRGVERQALRAGLARAGDGQPTVAVIAGEAGVGKTRLVTEFGAEAARAGVAVLVGVCPPLAGGLLPYAPLASALRTLTDGSWPGSLPRPTGQAQLALGSLVPDQYSDPAPTSSSRSSGELLEPLLALMGQLSAETTVALVIEDLHWADPSTLDFLPFLLRNLRRGRLFLVGTVRTDDLRRGHPLLSVLAELERSGVDRLDLAPFDREEVEQQVTGILQTPAPPEVAERIYARSGGNPFFAEELLAADASGTVLSVRLRDLLLARVDGLAASTQRLLEAVAVAGGPVEHDLLALVTGLAKDVLLSSLRQATEHHVLVSDGGQYEFRHALVQEAVVGDLLPGQSRRLHRRFAESLTDHPRISPGPATATTAALAYHWYEARDFGQALYATIAAALAAERFPAVAESLGYFRQALELWDLGYHPDRPPLLTFVDLHRHAAEAAHMIGEDGEAIALTTAAIALVDRTDDPTRSGMLYERLGRYLYTGGGDELATLSAYRRAVALVPDEMSTERARVLASMGQALMLSTRFAESRPYCEKATQVARQVGAAGEEVSALVTLAADLCHDDRESERGIALLRQCIGMASRAGALEEVHRGYANLGEALTDRLRLDEAAKLLTDGAGAAEGLGFIGAGSSLRCEAVEPLLLAGRWDEAEQHLATADRGRRHQLTHARFHLRSASLELRRGDFQGTRNHLSEVTQHLPVGGQNADVSEMHAVVAEMALWESRPDDAVDEVARALPAVKAGDNTYLLALLLWLGLRASADLAERRGARGRPASDVTRESDSSADVLLRCAVDLPRRLNPVPRARMYLLLVEAEHSRAEGRRDEREWQLAAESLEQSGCGYLAAYSRWRQAGAIMAGSRNRHRAADILVGAYQVACGLGAVPLQDEIDDLARRSGIALDVAVAAERSTTAVILGLTSREADVLAQLTVGRTNRQIASELYISEKTVATHVSHILAKLGVANRSQAAAAAHRAGLASAG